MRITFLLILALSLFVTAKKKKAVEPQDPDELSKQAFELFNAGKEEKGLKLFEKVLKIQPNNANALVQLGMRHMSKPGKEDLAFERLEKAFSDDVVPMAVPVHSPQGQWLASIIGRRRFELKDFQMAQDFFEKAATSRAGDAVCQKIQHASSMLTPYPLSFAEAQSRITGYMDKMNTILRMLEEGKELGPHDGDPYGFCLLSAFYHTAYYSAEHRITMGLHAQVALKAFPDLVYTAPHLQASAEDTTCHRRLKIGIVSGMMTRGTPPMADFGGVLGRLDRSAFNLTFIYLRELNAAPSEGILERRGWNEMPPYGYHQIVKEEDGGLTIERGPNWLQTARTAVGRLEVDLLLYLDATMSTMTTQLAMSRLAKVQAVSHGHPTTSGVPSSILDYYISWGAAELPTAAEHYTEELALLPAESMHQWYESRVTAEGASTESGEPFLHLTREDFEAGAEAIPADGRWYLCMQKPFKRHPEFDEILAQLQRQDPEARLLLHDAESAESKGAVRRRLKQAGVNQARVHMLSAVPHHRLLALYRLADVTLDSYPMGGCTTTREALEVGGLVVTLPSKYLGSRWSLAYYTIIGVLDLVADSPDEFVATAVRVASEPEVREELKGRVKERLGRMFRRSEAVEEWSKLLRRLAHKHNSACSA